ncbi:MAG: SDR family oxidoreductase [Anaeromyxobacter sp.]|nr:SDR family oxidoreductase [Anaeromyxobacter sp.]MBL0276772.1 SDR family oxidoreductase [Anaeromyxobacter sp.]
MKILVFGGDGMLGHQLLESWAPRHDVQVTLRQLAPAYAAHRARFGDRALYGVDVRRLDDLVGALAAVRPELVVNAVGLVKQRPTAHEELPSLEVNALYPHRLARACAAAGARLIHLSTDCVFSGARGNYRETDTPDPTDLYGRTKLLGEVDGPGCLTLRTSIIGLELGRAGSLVEWFLAQRGPVRGYRRAIYSGLTTQELARAIEALVSEAPDLCGVWHLASQPIDKHDLLTRLARRLGRTDVTLTPDDDFTCDRSLDASALRARTTYRVPSWDAMLDELAEAVRRRGSGT